MHCIVMFAKAPVPGAVKTRLMPPLSGIEAASLQEAFIFDTLVSLGEMDTTDIFIACHPGTEDGFFLKIKDYSGAALIPQGDGSLGDRMRGALQHLKCRGYSKIAIIGSDTPTFPVDYIRAAFERLEEKNIVIGPSLDGGYYLLATSGPVPDIFEGVAWGGESVFNETMERIRQEGMSYAVLPFWYDVDTIIELRFLGIHLSSLPPERYVRTRAVLEKLNSKILPSV